MAPKKILIVEDERIVAEDVRECLRESGYIVCGPAISGADALALAELEKPDLVLMDIVLQGDMDGIETARRLQTRLSTPVVFLTAYADEKVLARAKEIGPFGYLLKPFDERELRITVEVAFYKAQLERKLVDRERWLTTIVRGVGDALMATDATGNITLFNPSARRVTGWSQREAVGQHYSRVLNSAKEEVLSAQQFGAFSNEFVAIGISGTGLIFNRSGKSVPVESTITPIYEDRSEFAGVIIVFRDISERIRSEAELQKLNRDLIKLSRQSGMAEIATGILHNVGNVLNSVNVSAGTLREKVDRSRVVNLKKVADLIKHELSGSTSTERLDTTKRRLLPSYMADLADNLVDERSELLKELDLLATNIKHIKDIVARQQSYARIEQKTEPVSLEKVLEDALTIESAELDRLGVEIVRNYASLPEIPTDRVCLLQIIINLLSNALRALAQVDASQRRLVLRTNRTNANTVEISIHDTGNGIAKEHSDRIFTYGFTTEASGSGFGLHSSSISAQEMGGSLTAHSKGPGKGATFILALNAPDSLSTAASSSAC